MEVDPVETARGLLLQMARALVDSPDELEVDAAIKNPVAILVIRPSKLDMGKILGRGGKNIEAMRTILNGFAVRERMRVQVEVEE